jgi:hypothetical protein
MSFDLVTLVYVFRIAKFLYEKEWAAILAMFTYAIAFFAIQNTHFFVVDVFFTTFVTMALYYGLVGITRKPFWYFTISGIFSGAAIASKFTAVVFVAAMVVAFFIAYYIAHKRLTSALLFVVLIAITTTVVHIISMPYAYRTGASYSHTIPFDDKPASISQIESRFRMIANPNSNESPTLTPPRQLIYLATQIFSARYIMDTLEQAQMNKNPYVFPYTRQYVGTIPYLYYLQNIYIWGWGPILSVFTALGCLALVKKHLHSHLSKSKASILIFTSILTYSLYFIIIGSSAVKFMRYMLPLYPIFAVFAGWGLYRLLISTRTTRWIAAISIVCASIWTSMFINIYTPLHTRIQAKLWAQTHIPPQSKLAVEHWDDRPIDGPQYQYIEMTNYDIPDDAVKWSTLTAKLENTDYIVLASNRLSAPLSRMTNCKRDGIFCSTLAAQYYKDLLNEQPIFGRKNLTFKKVADFSAFPYLQIGTMRVQIDDTNADESFTVYDHPRILIYKKST